MFTGARHESGHIRDGEADSAEVSGHRNPWQWAGKTGVSFAVEMRFDLASGRPEEWQRLRIANFE